MTRPPQINRQLLRLTRPRVFAMIFSGLMLSNNNSLLPILIGDKSENVY